ncbi:DUF2057 domain-containing protein [Vibrio sp. JPW-9-11-11]|uniref:DUF2057 family protein n=1 Tax=Vibrio sp. JPW-9-11-11 TaxID=1416532 RepID=UPI001593D80B|nr:DUF2057 family protein [Vibrio sp. JPW-9-11-11]NVD07221.1 DUF2057 domain-containing protein [Vibrio sp. JPW-9-11-11]
MKQLILTVALLVMSGMTCAQVIIQTDSRVEILAVNQPLNPVPKTAKGDLSMANGQQQLLLRVTAMVDGNGGKRKFHSHPMVVRFEANNETLLFTTPFAIRDQRGVDKFEKNPTVKVTRNGEPVRIVMDQIANQSFALINDYDAMLAEYNRTGGVAAIPQDLASNTIHSRSTVPESPPRESTGDLPVLKQIEADFLSMTPEQRQAFISWAVKHIND